MKIDPIIGFIAQLPDIAYPTGCKFHHKNLILSRDNKIVPIKPKETKIIAGKSVAGIVVSHPSNLRKDSLANQTLAPIL